MITRLAKADIRIGMFVEAVEGAESSFGKRRFLLKNDCDLDAIQQSTAEFVVINTAFGADSVKARIAAAKDGSQNSLSPEEARAEAEEVVARATKALKAELISIVTGGAFDVTKIAPVIDQIVEADQATSSLFFEVSRLKHKDETTFQHSLAVGTLMGKLGDALDMDRETVELLVLSGLIHDVGKLTISQRILQKQGPLTPAERKLIQMHPRRGHQILKQYAAIPEEALDICLHHHEVLDGSGYPSRLSGSKIGPLVRVSTVCDVFEALTSARPYKHGWPVAEALTWMFDRDHLFDRKLVIRLGGVI